MTLDSTASMKARRASSWVFADRKRAVCSSRRPAIRLNAVASVWTSSSVSAIGTRAEKSPCSMRPAAVDQLAHRTDHAVGDLQGGEDRQADDDQRAEKQRER